MADSQGQQQFYFTGRFNCKSNLLISAQRDIKTSIDDEDILKQYVLLITYIFMIFFSVKIYGFVSLYNYFSF